MSLINRGKIRSASKDLDKSNEKSSEEEGLPYSRVGACARGIGKVLRGAVAAVPGVLLGLCGVGMKDSYEIMNAPIGDWWQLAKRKIKEVNKNRGWGKRIGYGFLGLLTGSLTAAGNTIKDGFLGTIQAAAGGLGLISYFKKIGVPPEMIAAILKTGNPFGYLLVAAGSGADGLSKLMDKLNNDLSKYKSLNDVSAKVNAEIQQNPDLKSIMDRITSGKVDFRNNVDGDGNQLNGSQASPADVLNSVSERLSSALNSGLKKVGGQLDHLKERAKETASRGVDFEKQLAASYQNLVRDVPAVQQVLQTKLGIAKEQIQVEKDSIMIKGKQTVAGVKELLEDPKAKFSGLVVKATSKEKIIEKLVKTGDLDLVDKLAVVKIKSKHGPEKVLTQEEVKAMIEEIKQRMQIQPPSLKPS